MHELYHHCLFYNVRILYVGRGEKMKNEITEKLELFMQNLRCEDMSRETLVHLDSCRIESERLAELEEEYRQTMIELIRWTIQLLHSMKANILLSSLCQKMICYPIDKGKA